MSVMQLWFHRSLSAGEEAPVSVLHRGQRKRMGDGISNTLHQGHRWSTCQRGAPGRTKEWSCEYLHEKILLFNATFRMVETNCACLFLEWIDLTWILRMYSECSSSHSAVFCCVDPEDICRQPVSHHTTEAVVIRALPGHERLQQ